MVLQNMGFFQKENLREIKELKAKDGQFFNFLKCLDQQMKPRECIKVGVIYAGPDCYDENQILLNDSPSEEYSDFIS